MYQLIEWLVFHLPSRWHDEATDTSWVSWGGARYHLTVTYWPLKYATITLGGWSRAKSWSI